MHSFNNELCLVINATKTANHGLRLTLLSKEQGLFYASASGISTSKQRLSAILRPFSLIEARLDFKSNFTSLSDAKSLLLYYDFFDDKALYIASFYNELLIAFPAICQHNNIFLFYNELYNKLVKKETASLRCFLVFFVNFLGLLETAQLDKHGRDILSNIDFEQGLSLDWNCYSTASLLEQIYILKQKNFKSLELLKSVYPSLLG